MTPPQVQNLLLMRPIAPNQSGVSPCETALLLILWWWWWWWWWWWQGWSDFFSQSTTYRAEGSSGTLHHIVRTCVDPNFDNFDGTCTTIRPSIQSAAIITTIDSASPSCFSMQLKAFSVQYSLILFVVVMWSPGMMSFASTDNGASFQCTSRHVPSGCPLPHPVTSLLSIL
jgi:hypothetical protein